MATKTARSLKAKSGSVRQSIINDVLRRPKQNVMAKINRTVSRAQKIEALKLGL